MKTAPLICAIHALCTGTIVFAQAPVNEEITPRAQSILAAIGVANPNVSLPGDRTPLLLAFEKGDNVMIKLLLDAGAWPNVSDGMPFGNETPLITATRQANVEGVRLLLAHGADVNATEAHGWTALSLALSPTNTHMAATWNTEEFERRMAHRRQQVIAPLLRAAGATEAGGPVIRLGASVGF